MNATAAVMSPAENAERALLLLGALVGRAAPGERAPTLRDAAMRLREYVDEGLLNPATVRDQIWDVAERYGLSGEPGSDQEIAIGDIVHEATAPPGMRDSDDGPPQWFIDKIMPEPAGPEAYGLPIDGDRDLTPAPTIPLPLICPPQWRDVPLEPMRWLATHRIPAREPTILGGDGGGGKTTVALQLGVANACDLGDWLGTTVETGPVIFFSAEEPEAEMRRRLERVARKRGIAPADIEQLHFHFADPDRCLLGVSLPNGTMAPTPLFESLCAAAVEIRPVLVIVDSIAATFGGNQNDRVQARTFVSMFRRLAREADCAVLLLDHPSLSGMTNGTGRAGSMDWNNAVRARLHLRPTENDEGGTGRELEVMKSNYGPAGEKVKLQWEDGCFVLEASATGPRLAAAYASADQGHTRRKGRED